MELRPEEIVFLKGGAEPATGILSDCNGLAICNFRIIGMDEIEEGTLRNPPKQGAAKVGDCVPSHVRDLVAGNRLETADPRGKDSETSGISLLA